MSDLLKGKNFIVIPKVTTYQRNALTVINGLLVYDTTLNAFYKYENGAWSTFAGGSGTSWGAITGTLSSQTDLATALSNKADASSLTSHISNTSNPHSVTKSQVGLGNVDNTSDLNKPVSTATQAALDLKQNSLGYTAENSANKTDTMSGNEASSTKYLSAKGVYDWVVNLGYQVALTAANFGTFLTGLTSKTTPVDDDEFVLADSAASNAAKKVTGTNFKAYLKTYFDTLYSSKHTLIGVTKTTVQGTALEAIAETITIPAAWFTSGDGFNISSFASKSSQTVNDTWVARVYLNSAANLTGAVEIIRGAPLSNNIRWHGIERKGLVIRSATTMQTMTVTSGALTDIAAGSLVSPQTVTIPNIANQMYLLVTLQHNGSSQADTLTHIKTVLNKEVA